RRSSRPPRTTTTPSAWRPPRATSGLPWPGSRSRSSASRASSSTAAGSSVVVGVLAPQGDCEAHAGMLVRLGAEARIVRVPADLDGLDGLVIPGGESTTMTLGIEREGLGEALREFVGGGRPVLGTCAGLIMLDRDHLGLLDVGVRRNAFGRQL